MSRIFHHDSFKKKRRERIQVIVILSIVFFCLLGCAGVGTENVSSVTANNSETELQGQDSEEVMEEVTEETTEAVTEETTEAVTEETTEAVTEETTEAVTEEATEAMTEAATEEATQAATEEVTEEVIRETANESQEPVQTNTYILNTNTKKFHYPGCKSVKKMKESNKAEYTGTRDEVIAQGYSPCGNCHP